MLISFIDPEYRSNIIFAIHRYQMLKPNTRLDDVAQCLAIARAEHRSHGLLNYALRKYLDDIHTGFHLFGLKSLPVKTGRSVLRTLIFQALHSKSERDLLAYELAEQERIKSADSNLSHDQLIVRHAELLSDLERIQAAFESLQNRNKELEIEYKMIRSDHEKLEKKLIDALRNADKLSVENMGINHTLLELIEEKNALAEVNKRLYRTLESKDQAADTASKPRIATTPF